MVKVNKLKSIHHPHLLTQRKQYIYFEENILSKETNKHPYDKESYKEHILILHTRSLNNMIIKCFTTD